MRQTFNGKSQAHSFLGGMNLDLDVSTTPDGVYAYGENIRLSVNKAGTDATINAITGFKFLSNDDVTYTYFDGDVLKRSVLTDDIKFIGVSTIRDYTIIFATYSDGDNAIFRLRINDDNIILHRITKTNLNINNGEDRDLSVVSYWEDDDNIKIYWADGVNNLRSINVSPDVDFDNSKLTAESFNNIISTYIDQPEISKIVPGNLKCGLVQYAYQLFNKNGAESVISPTSFAIHLTDKNKTSAVYSGNSSDTSSGKSVQFMFEIPDERFVYARIYRIRYDEAEQLPKIDIISEIEVNTFNKDGKRYQLYTDPGSSISEISYEEFVVSNPYTFIPKVIESKDGRLFTGDIIEDTLDIETYDYDARAFRFGEDDKYGVHTKLDSTSGNDMIVTFDNIMNMSDEEWANLVPSTHDCINPYNSDDKSIYRYGLNSSGGLGLLGGYGRNVSYAIVNTRFGEDFLEKRPFTPRSEFIDTTKRFTYKDSASNYTIGRNTTMHGNSLIMNYGMPSITSDGYDVGASIEVSREANMSDYGDRNYSNPILSSRFKSYQRDEVYRFGIVFHNDLGQTSTVKWIGDIRMPSMTESEWRLFDMNERIKTDSGADIYQVVTYPIGLQLYLQNIPEGVTSIELVRCERTRLDRTIAFQGLISYVNQNQRSGGQSVMTPMLFPSLYRQSYDNRDGVIVARDGSDSIGNTTPSAGTVTFLSPEISYFGESLLDYYNTVSKLEVLTAISSPMNANEFAKSKYNEYLGNKSYRVPCLSNIHYNYKPIDSNIVLYTDGMEYMGRAHEVGGRDHKWKGYTAKLYKYYCQYNKYITRAKKSDMQMYVNNIGDVSIINSRYAGDISYGDYYATLDESAHDIPFAGVTYKNWSWIQWHKLDDKLSDSENKTGPYSRTLLLNLDIDVIDVLNIGGAISNWDYSFIHGNIPATNSTFLCNLKSNVTQYGGYDYNSRFQNTYISTSFIFDVDNNGYANGVAFGGDTFIGLGEIVTRHQYFEKTDPLPSESEFGKKGGKSGQVTIIFPCESSINLSLTHGSKPSDDPNFNKTTQITAGTFPNGDSQSKNLYSYNSVYSKDNLARKYIPAQMYTEDNKRYDYRVTYSGVKSNDEITDSWLKFKPADYMDLDTRYGKVNNLKLFNNSLLFWQEDAFGELPVNQRSIIQDNNDAALLIGTGDALGRPQYITTANGSTEWSYNANIITPSAIHWFDKKRNELLSFGDGLQVLSKIKGIQSFFNKNTVEDRPRFGYDKKFNEVIFRFNTVNGQQFNIIFSEKANVFQSFYSYDTDWMFNQNGNLYSFYKNNIREHNGTDILNEFRKNKYDNSVITYNSAESYPITKVFDNVELYAEKDSGKISMFFETRDHKSAITTVDIQLEDTYRLAIPRANVIENTGSSIFPTIHERMRGKYLTSTLFYSPIGGTKFKIPYVATAYRQSNI